MYHDNGFCQLLVYIHELKSFAIDNFCDIFLTHPVFFSGGLPYDLSEGDILCVFSQYVKCFLFFYCCLVIYTVY